MTRDEAAAILEMPRDKAIEIILALADKAEKYDQTTDGVSPTAPSGNIPVYLKPSHRKRKKRPGRKNGHRGESRTKPDKIDEHKEHTLDCCPNCQTPVEKAVQTYCRYIEDVPPMQTKVTEHKVHGYWCPKCRKIVFPIIKDALPNARIGLRVIVFTAWLHYLVGVSINNLVKMLSVFSSFRISPGGLTQAWKNLAFMLEPVYNGIGQKVANSAVLHADETGWRLNGSTVWLWCFATKAYCYYLITDGRGSPVVRRVLGTVFRGILICDFWGAYNKICALAKQRCFYHLFTELAKVDKHNSSLKWKVFRKKLSRLLKDAVRLSSRKEQLGPEHYRRLRHKLHDRLDEFISAPYEDKDAKRLIKRLRRHKDELFTFLEHEGISPYNNHAEQQMRKPVLTRRVSQQNRSDQAAKAQAILMTLFRTAELQGKNPVETVLSFAGKAIESKTLSTEDVKLAA